MRSRVNVSEYRIIEFSTSSSMKGEGWWALTLRMIYINNGNWRDCLYVQPVIVQFEMGKTKHIQLPSVGLISINDFLNNRALYKRYLSTTKLGRCYG